MTTGFIGLGIAIYSGPDRVQTFFSKALIAIRIYDVACKLARSLGEGIVIEKIVHDLEGERISL